MIIWPDLATFRIIFFAKELLTNPNYISATYILILNTQRM